MLLLRHRFHGAGARAARVVFRHGLGGGERVEGYPNEVLWFGMRWFEAELSEKKKESG